MSHRFRRDVLWNLASVATLGASGFALSVVIGRYYGPEVFGVFSQVLTVYYVLSQLAVGGFIFSVLKFAADHADDRGQAGPAIVSAAVLTAGLAAIVGLVAWVSSDWIGAFFDSQDVARGVRWTIPGLGFLALNRVLLFSLNGLRHMRFYAVGNTLRFSLILVTLVGLTALRVEGPVLPACLWAGELLLLPVLVLYLRTQGYLPLSGPLRPWMRRHLHFGLRAFFGGLLLDVNLKVDVALLGFFATDRVVGIYSFAAMIAEGLYQIVFVVQTNVTPILSRLKLEHRTADVRSLVRRNLLWLPPSLALVTLIVSAVFPWLAERLMGNAEFAGGRIYFAVLMGGFVVASSYLPFAFVLNQWGHPAWFMGYLALLVTGNVALNVLLIPPLGAMGAAVGTAVASALGVVYLKLLTRWATGTSI